MNKKKNTIQSLKVNMNRDIRQVKRKYLFFKIKCFLLFVLPILLIIIGYQAAKQFLKIKMKQLGSKVQEEVTHPAHQEIKNSKTDKEL